MTSRPQVAAVLPTLGITGGTEQITAGELRALAGTSDLTVFTPDRENRPPEPATVNYVHVPRRPGVLATEAWFRAASKAVHQRRRDFDVVFSPGMNCDCATHIEVHAIFAHMADIARTAPRHALREQLRRWRFRRLAMWEQRLYGQANCGLATVSHKAAERLQYYYGRDATVLPAEPDFRRFEPDTRRLLRGEARQQLQLPERTFTVLTVGNAWHSKGFDLLLEAWQALDLPDSQLLVLTSERPGYLRKRLGPRLDQLRLLPTTEKIETLYAAADLVVLASRGETFGLPIVEAHAMGTPVLVSGEAGASNYMPSECVISPNTVTAWQAALHEAHLRGAGWQTTSDDSTVLVQRMAARTQAFLDWVLGS